MKDWIFESFQYPKRAYGMYCKFNPILKWCIPLKEVFVFLFDNIAAMKKKPQLWCPDWTFNLPIFEVLVNKFKHTNIQINQNIV